MVADVGMIEGRTRGCSWFEAVSVIALLTAFGLTPASGAEPPQVQIGFDGRLKVGRYTPVLIEWNDSAVTSCEVIVSDPDGVRIASPLDPIADTNPANADAKPTNERWLGIVRPGQIEAQFEFRSQVESGNISSQRVSSTAAGSSLNVLPQGTPLWLEVGFVTELLAPVSGLETVRLKSWPEIAELPLSLDGVDGVFVSSETTLNEPARTELLRWLRGGGQLLLTVTTDADAFHDSAWSSLLKTVVEVGERTRTSDLSGIESFTGQARRITGGNRTPITTLQRKEGVNLVTCLEGTLAMRAAIGFGQVTVIGLDFTAPPISRWEGRTALLRKFLFQTVGTTTTKLPEDSRLSQSGITDLVSQWRAATIQIPGVSRSSVWTVLGFLLIYGIIIGPLDYLVVHRFLRRPHWTWVTLPLLVSIAATISVCWAHAGNGHASRFTQHDVIDIDSSDQTVTSRSWATVYSDQHRLWNFSANVSAMMPTPTEPIPARISWLGIPENASGGMYRSRGFSLMHSLTHQAANQQSWHDLPISQWSSKSLTAEATWQSEVPLIECSLTSDSSGGLAGEVMHHLPGTLTDWLVAFEGRVFVSHPNAGEAATQWEPGQKWNPQSPTVYGRERKGYLTRTTTFKRLSKKGVLSEDILTEQEKYNPLNLEPADILRMMTLHEAAGGKSYTGLDHASLRAFDLSPLLNLDRAVLIGRLAKPLVNWHFHGELRQPDQHHTFVRVLLPVRRQSDPTKLRILPKLDANKSTNALDQTSPTSPTSAPNEIKTP